MFHKIKNIVNTFVFVGIIAVFAVWCVTILFNPSTDMLVGENRNPAQLPENVTWEQLLNNKVEIDEAGNEIQPPIKQFEEFAVDQFPLRQFFRYIKAHFAMDVLGLKENNGYAVEEGSIVQVKPSFSESNTDYQIGRLEYMYNTYLKDNGGNHYVSLIPDKNYYFGSQYGYPTADYKALVEKLTSSLGGMEYIDIFGSLELSDYYKTDWHWDQSKLDGVVETLGEAMGFGDRMPAWDSYTRHELDFSGGYSLQSALRPDSEKLTYFMNDVLEKCRVYNYATKRYDSLYDMAKYEKGDPQYAFFLSDGVPLQRIDNPNATTDKKLIVFRDSFGSSILPLLSEGYASIYVVDLRLINPDFVVQMIGDISDMDVLYLYSTMVLNEHSFLKEVKKK